MAVDYNKKALKFLYDVMSGKIQEVKIVVAKCTKKHKQGTEDTTEEIYQSKSFEVPAELETRMKAAERLLKYNIEIRKQETENEITKQTSGVVLLPMNELMEDTTKDSNNEI